MICTAIEALDVARSQIGYCEKNDSKHLDSFGYAGSKNYTKYARDLYAVKYWSGNKQAADWCTTFCAWVFYTACGDNVSDARKVQPWGNYGASCKWQTKYYKEANRWSVTPHVGDQAFFTRGHTGLVEKVGEKTITLIEGNSRNKVERRTYTWPNSIFSGFGMPQYSKETVKPTPTVFEPYYVKVTPSNGLNVRTGPATGYKKLGALKYGTRIYILEVKNGWGRIDFNGKAGWVSLTYTKKV